MIVEHMISVPLLSTYSQEKEREIKIGERNRESSERGRRKKRKRKKRKKREKREHRP